MLIALDIAILPPPAISERAIELSAALPEKESIGLRLGDDNLPHITLTQQFIQASDLDAALDRVGAALDEFEALPLRVTGPAKGSSSVWMAIESHACADRASSSADGRVETVRASGWNSRGIRRWRGACRRRGVGCGVPALVELRHVHAAHHAGTCRGPACRRASRLRCDDGRGVSSREVLCVPAGVEDVGVVACNSGAKSVARGPKPVLASPMARRSALLAFLLVCLAQPGVRAQTPVAYRLSFPEAAHHLMQVEVTFTGVPAGTLELRMSRTSPGRYSLHEFAKNVFDVRITDESGKALAVARPNPHQWDVTGHSGYCTRGVPGFWRPPRRHVPVGRFDARAHQHAGRLDVGARVRTPAHHGALRSPGGDVMASGYATVARERPADVHCAESPVPDGQPDGTEHVRAAVVHRARRPPYAGLPGGGAPHRDGRRRGRPDARHRGDRPRGAARVWRVPAFEGNTYTFIADYLPSAHSDGMEHRNSTVLTSASPIQSSRLDLLDTVAHEFFHVWNVERIRPKSLEPFNLEEANMSGELWFAEGFTSYYGPLTLKRTGLTTLRGFAREMGDAIERITVSPARQLRSAVEMSRLAPFADSFATIDQTNFSNTYISYYTWGTALGLGLDLSLRERTDGKVTLDTFMRALWDRVRPARRERAGIRRDSVHARRPEDRAWQRVGRCRLCRGLLQPLCGRTRRPRLRSTPRAGRHPGEIERRPCLCGRSHASGRPGWRSHHRRTCRTGRRRTREGSNAVICW